MQELKHHGILGQKWGIRRFQNEDGSLTEAGRVRYGGSKNHSEKDGSLVREISKSSFVGARTLANARVTKLQNKVERRRAQGKDTEKLERKLNAQKAANANRKTYEDYTSTGKMLLQDNLMGTIGATIYRHARARGESRVRSLMETGFAFTPIGFILRRSGDKKAYVAATWSDSSEGFSHGNSIRK